MTTTRVFRSGNSQAVRLPRDFRFDVEEVEIFRRGDEVVLREPIRSAARVFHLLGELPDDVFGDERRDEAPQERSW